MSEASYTLVGKYVDLRPLTTEDAATTLRWRNSLRARYLNRGADSVEQQKIWIAARPKSELNFIIQLKSGDPVGMLSLVEIDLYNLRAETGRFLIGEEDEVKGIPVAVESMSLLYELAFDSMGLQRLYGTVAANNGLMVKWQKYLGMKEEGRLRSHYLMDGAYQDAICLGILKSEYDSVFLPRSKVLMSAAAMSVS